MTLSYDPHIFRLEQTWRWFGPEDPISLSNIKMTGATGIVTALHHIPNGQVWPIEEIMARKKTIENAGMSWSVVESVPVHEEIKQRNGQFKEKIDNYKKTISNLGNCGIDTLCYNFMPVLDWTRTDLNFQYNDGSKALRFDITALIAFELFILKRLDAFDFYSEKQIEKATIYFQKSDNEEKKRLTNNIIAGLPGSEEKYSLKEFRKILDSYKNIDSQTLKTNLISFLKAIIPTAEQSGVRMCIHPDDPPFPILGLPRVVSTEADLIEIFDAIKSINNGLTFCTGSLGVREDNDLNGIIKRLGNRIHFVHLRSTKRDFEGSFYEANHLDGDVDMFEIMKALINEQAKRVKNNRKDIRLPFRPDHGHQILNDIDKKTNPGYSEIGRLKGLAELRGLELGIRKSIQKTK